MASSAQKKIMDVFSLKVGEERHASVLKDVRQQVMFRNANLWILMCSILIASIGLNVNSTAVVIGAMLISPLMGPIVGAGFALATYDFDLLKKAAFNTFVATVVSLAVAALYFLVSPFKETQSEILSRTSPTIYDVLIAFLGGLVGVISFTRVEKGYAIAGVAIATALMPPICAAGYGLAIGNITYFFGAFYLYSINCFFICIATFFVTRFLRYPKVKSVDEKYDGQIRRWLTVLFFIMLLPSGYLAYGLFQEKKFIQKAEMFITEEFSRKGEIIIYKKIRYKTNPRVIEVALLSRNYSADEILELENAMVRHGVGNAKLMIRQDVVDLPDDLETDVSPTSMEISQKNLEIARLHERLQGYNFARGTLAKEVNAVFPEIDSYSVGRHHNSGDSTSSRLVFLYVAGGDSKPDTAMLKKWVRARWDQENVTIIEEPSSGSKESKKPAIDEKN